MPASLNHTIVNVRDAETSAASLARILGLPPPKRAGRFMAVELANGVTLDFNSSSPPIARQHYAFAVGEEEFDPIFERVRNSGEYWADPGLTRPGETYDRDGSRGVYFKDADGHLLEVLTLPGE